MDGPVKIGSKLPKPEALNGLPTVHDALLDENGAALVVMRIAHAKLVTHPGGITEPVARIEHIEGIDPTDTALVDTAERLLKRARTARAQRAAEVGAPSEPIPGLVLNGGDDDDGPPLDDHHPDPFSQAGY